MNISVHPGTYVVAVSGGVDSMALLEVLCTVPQLTLIVAHFDHGIRPDSTRDRRLVAQTARRLGLPFRFETANLGPNASEALARAARYRFLESIRAETNARAIIMAHHQDDLLETAIINLIRGTGRKGLTALADRAGIVRPFLGLTKREIVAYATAQRLEWREDSTNENDAYLRNYIRHRIMPRMSDQSRRQLLDRINRLQVLNRDIDDALTELWPAISDNSSIERTAFTQLPHAVSKEVMARWLRTSHIGPFNAKMVDRAVIGAKTKQPGKRIDLMGGAVLAVHARTLALEHHER